MKDWFCTFWGETDIYASPDLNITKRMNVISGEGINILGNSRIDHCPSSDDDIIQNYLNTWMSGQS